MVGRQNILRCQHIYLGQGYLSAFPLRPDHAFGLEGVYPCDIGVAAGGGRMDANLLQYLELKEQKI